MRRHWKNILLVAFLSLCTAAACAQTQSSDTNYEAERKKAIDLFNADKNLEALPLFEDLVKQNPRDDVTLLGLAACLLSHSATVEDEDAAAKERIRARELLLKSKDLGNNSNLLQNLLQMVPEDGRISYGKTAEDQAMQKGEAAFARNDFPEAIKNYSRALELNPKNYSAALFVGDSYFGAKDWAKAGEWYEKAIQINPDVETAYRYYADMLTRNGEMDKARSFAIRAVVAEPYNAVTWRGLDQWAKANHLALVDVQINVPQNSVSQTADKKIQINMDPSKPQDVSAVWLAYSMKRALWRGDEFKKHFPQEKEYRHSLQEEAEALTTAANVCLELTTSNSKSKEKKASSSAPSSDPDLLLLLKVYQAKMIEPYALLSAPDEGIAHDYDGYRTQNRSKLEAYLSDFIVPLAPSR
jgi:tetratricopeptide (TPR) repeat protein